MPVLLVTGASGFLGSAVCRAAQGWDVHGTWWTAHPGAGVPGEHHHVDLRDFQELGALLMRVRPEAIVHTAYRQDDPEPWPLNLAAPVRLAGAAVGLGARLVHMSTDLVFDAAPAGRGLREDDPPAPLSAYGRGKARAEAMVLERCPAATVVRTSLLIDGRGGSKHEQLALDPDATHFSDEVRCPIGVDDLAQALLELLGVDQPGLFHLAGADALTRLELARLVVARHGRDPDTVRGAPGPPGRPKDLRMESSRPLRGARELLDDRGPAQGRPSV